MWWKEPWLVVHQWLEALDTRLAWLSSLEWTQEGRVVVGESNGIYGWSPFSKRDTFLSLALDFKGYIQFLRRSSKSRSQWLLLTEERLQLSISLLFWIRVGSLMYMWHKHLQKKLPLARVDISRVFVLFFWFHQINFLAGKGKNRKRFFAECPYVIKDLPKVTDKVLCLCSFVPFNVPNGCQIAIVVLVIPRFVTP